MLRFALLFCLGLGLVAWTVWFTGRRAIAVAGAAILAGAGIALAGALLVDCRACHTAPLAVGMLVSLPFFIVGWIALVASRADRWRGGWFIPLFGAMLVQALWAIPLVRATTLGGQCPCAGFLFNPTETTLSAIGVDRWVGPVLLVEAVLTLWLAWSAFRAPPGRSV